MKDFLAADVWFQKLTLPRLALAYWLGRGARLTVYAPRASLAAAAFARLVAYFTDRNPWKAVVVEMGAVNAKGRAIRYDVEAACAHIGNRLLEELGDLKSVLPADYQDLEDDWRRLLRAHLIAHAAAPLTFIFFAANFSRESDAAKRKTHVFVSSKILSGFIANNLGPLAPDGLRLHALPTFSEIGGYFPFPGLLLLSLLRLWKESQRASARFDVPEDVVSQGVVIEQYCKGLLDRYPLGGHLFWHKHSGFSARRVALLANRADSPLTEEVLANLRRHGFSWIDGSNHFAFFENALRDGLKAILTTLRFLPKRLDPVEFWRWQQSSFFALHLEAYRSLARRFNVRMLHQNEEQSALPLLMIMAVRKEGGLFFWNHWSVSHYPFAREGCGMADLLLAWGGYDLGFRAAMGFRHAWQAVTGPIVGSTLSADRLDDARRFRKQFTTSVTFVIALFDSSHGPTTHQPTSTLVSFLKAALAAADARASWGLLMKTKKSDGAALLDHPEIEALSLKLQKMGRLVALDSLVQPAEAAMAADACVSYSINSAGIVSALQTDTPTLHCDAANISNHMLYQLGAEGTVLFKSTSSLIEALTRLEGGDGSIGNFSKFRKIFDVYCDGLGNQRAGELIGCYLRERDNGLDREAALKAALDFFAKRYGADKIVSAKDAQNADLAAEWRKMLDELKFEPYLPPSRRVA